MDNLKKLIKHCIWANNSWIQFLSGINSDAEYLNNMMSHILLSEQAWFQRISAVKVDREIWNTLSIKELEELHQRHTKTFDEFLDQNLNKVINYRRFNGEAQSAEVSDILLHLCTHGAHHRGQMASFASNQGMEVIKTDYIHYCNHFAEFN